MDKSKQTLFDQSYADFKKIYTSPEMCSFIQKGYKLKKRCRRLLILMLLCGLILAGIYLSICLYTSFCNLTWAINGSLIAFAFGCAIGTLFDRKITVMSYRDFYVTTLSAHYSELLQTWISLNSTDVRLYNDSPFAKKKKVRYNTNNKGFRLDYRGLTAQMYANFSTRNRILFVLVRYLFIYACIIGAVVGFLTLLDKYTSFNDWMLSLNKEHSQSWFIIFSYLAIIVLLFMASFGYLFYKAIVGLTASNFSIRGIESIQIKDSVIWIKRRTNPLTRRNEATLRTMSFTRNKLRFNRIDLNRDFDVSVQTSQKEELGVKMQEAKTILNPMIEDLLSYINKKYKHFDMAISRDRIDIQFLDDIMMRKNNKVLNQLMNPVLFSNKDLYISNMYHFYEVVELLKLISKYFYCGNQAELVTSEERALLERSTQLEKVPVSHFRRDNKKYLKQILKENN